MQRDAPFLEILDHGQASSAEWNMRSSFAAITTSRAARKSRDCSDYKRNERRHAVSVTCVGLAELAAHEGLLDPQLAPIRREREDDGEHAAPLPDRQRGSGQGHKNAGVDRVADPAIGTVDH